MLDYAYFALMFLLATGLAPEGSRTVLLENTRHPEQRMEWVARDGSWAMTLNGRDMGRFRREGDVVIHETGVRAPDRYGVAELLADVMRRDVASVRLGPRWAGRTLQVTREARGGRRLEDPDREVLPVPLVVRGSP